MSITNCPPKSKCTSTIRKSPSRFGRKDTKRGERSILKIDTIFDVISLAWLYQLFIFTSNVLKPLGDIVPSSFSSLSSSRKQTGNNLLLFTKLTSVRSGASK